MHSHVIVPAEKCWPGIVSNVEPMVRGVVFVFICGCISITLSLLT